MAQKYSMEYDSQRMARALGRDLGISAKQSIEICAKLRKQPIAKAKRILTDAIAHKRAIPLTRFNGDVGHKPGMGPGRFMNKASDAILKLLESAEHNAVAKGLNKDNLVITHMNAHKASTPFRYGRQSRRSAKRTHIEVYLMENVVAKKSEKTQKTEVSK